MSNPRPPLFTSRFLAIWAVSFAAAAASFQLLPAAPFRIRDLGGSTATSGLFLGLLTYGSALSAPWTGALADLLGRRRVLLVSGLALAGLGAVYAVVPRWEILVLLALPHGVAWSSVLTAASAYVSDLVPVERRAEGIAYHGLASTLAIAAAPALGFALSGLGWGWLCLSIVAFYLAVSVLALRLPERVAPRAGSLGDLLTWKAVEWPTLAFSGTLLLVSFGYGGVTSFVAQLAESRGIVPKGIFFTAFAGTILVCRPLLGSSLDRFGPRRAVPICIGMVATGLAVLPIATGRSGLVVAAVLFGGGFSTFYPAFSALVLRRVAADRRGAAFGAMLAAFDVGIGSGSILLGPLVARLGFAGAFGLAAAVAATAWPFFLWSERRFSLKTDGGADARSVSRA